MCALSHMTHKISFHERLAWLKIKLIKINLRHVGGSDEEHGSIERQSELRQQLAHSWHSLRVVIPFHVGEEESNQLLQGIAALKDTYFCLKL